MKLCYIHSVHQTYITEPGTKEADGLYYRIIELWMRHYEARRCCHQFGYRLIMFKTQFGYDTAVAFKDSSKV